MATEQKLEIDVHAHPSERIDTLREDALVGLSAPPREIPPKWFYDDLGSVLFDAITRIPEYYPTNCEKALLVEHATELAERSGADTLVEIGSGTSEKTRHLLDAMSSVGRLEQFIAFDVSEAIMRSAVTSIESEYPGIRIRGVVGDFDHHLGLIPKGGRRIVAVLGSTIGNLLPKERELFFKEIAGNLERGDCLLLGLDLVKTPERILAAYDDPHGVTAAFNRNVLAVLNRELGANFDLSKFEHAARWDSDNQWIEMRLRAVESQHVIIKDLNLDFTLSAGEEIRTEISAKFTREGVEAELGDAGLDPAGWFTDEAEDFALSLSRAI